MALDISNKCSCNDVGNMMECNKSTYCAWSDTINQCIQSDCASSLNCQYHKGCAFIGGKCLEKPCSQLNGRNKLECQEQSAYCTYIDGKCADVVPNSCGDLNADTCDQGSFYDSCMWVDGECLIVKNCEQIGKDALMCAQQNACSYQNGHCIQKECKFIPLEKNCRYILSFNKQNVSICHWNGQQCQQGDEQNLNKDNCYDYTFQAYHWVDEKCISCYNESNSIPLIMINLLLILLS